MAQQCSASTGSWGCPGCCCTCSSKLGGTAGTRLEMSPSGRVAVPLRARSIAPTPSSVSSRSALTTAVRSTPSMSTVTASPMFCWWEPPCTSARAEKGGRFMSTPCGRYVAALRGRAGDAAGAGVFRRYRRNCVPSCHLPRVAPGCAHPPASIKHHRARQPGPKATELGSASLLWLLRDSRRICLFSLFINNLRGFVRCQRRASSLRWSRATSARGFAAPGQVSFPALRR